MNLFAIILAALVAATIAMAVATVIGVLMPGDWMLSEMNRDVISMLRTTARGAVFCAALSVMVAGAWAAYAVATLK